MANEDWWGYVKRVIREYPELQRKLESVGETPCVPAYGASGGRAGTISNPVESAVGYAVAVRLNNNHVCCYMPELDSLPEITGRPLCNLKTVGAYALKLGLAELSGKELMELPGA